MPFGLGIAPAIMSSLATALTEHLRQTFSFVWSHLDDFIVADDNIRKFNELPALLQTWQWAGLQINFEKSSLQPSKNITALSANWTRDAITPTQARIDQVNQAIQAMPHAKPGTTRQRSLMGLIYYVAPFLPKSPFALLTAFQNEPTQDNAALLLKIWNTFRRPITWNDKPRPPEEPVVAVSDATTTGMGIVSHNCAKHRPTMKTPIYQNELTAALWAIVDFRPNSLFCDNLAVVFLLNKFRRSCLPFLHLAHIYSTM